ncbi:molecular chaperone [Pantoea sp. CCBC3-3-1]|uniref:fimbrial biogenesis chaperone n=1 Tax=Pantoea sp. CCBC3-3-1 TaxID=2490851 RepID=UPI0011BDE9AC|nr:fimbria/pilus periplasmic chaperone [Pantoea sp. CCBC3-3-1]
MNKYGRFSLTFSCFAIVMFAAATVSASVVISGTRVIYPSDAREVSVKLSNVGKKPVLVQSWVDSGDSKAKPETIHVPFVLTPPINRVEAGKGQTLRISQTGEALPTDRESIFWLNILEIPAKDPKLKNENYLQMAFRSRIKFFYRPVNLAGNANSAVNNFKWKTEGKQLIATNSGPYYVSFVTLSVKRKKVEGKMVAPFSSESFSLASVKGDEITGEFVNDYGAIAKFTARIM